MDFLRDLSVLVLGLGDSGLAMARWCARHGARVRVWDSREEPPQAAALREALPAAELHTGPIDVPSLLEGVRLVLKSPGLSPLDERVAPLLRAAAGQGLAQLGELGLFTRALAELEAAEGWAPRVLAITGTNGKTTTTALTALLVERAGRRAVAAGNIGPTLLDTLAAALDRPAAERPEVFVLELSSFQLDGAHDFEPDAAAVLNLTQDHLDWHGTVEAYAAAKARAFGPQAFDRAARTVRVVNRNDPRVEAMVSPLAAPAPVRGQPRARAAEPGPVVRFGLDAPRRAGDWGLVTENGMAWLVRAMPADETVRGSRRRAAEDEEIHLQRLMPADALRLRGRHNAANALAALALATAIGCPLAPMLHGLREYRGEPHRVEPVGRVRTAAGEVEAFDDSKGTNVGATVAALDGLGPDVAPGRLLVILGGDGKGQDFAPLVEPLVRVARGVATIGRDAGAIEAAVGPALRAAGIALQRHADLPAAVGWCFDQARGGDAVLLSPACASLDMFRNYAHRAEVFVEAVRERAREHGDELGAAA